MQNKYKQLSKRLIKYSLCGVLAQSAVFASAFASEANIEKNVTTVELYKQAITVKGTVTSEDGAALPGVNIILKGTNKGTTTDLDGNFTLEVPDESAVLVFTFIGYSAQEITVGARSVINVSMIPDTQQLSEVVVVGYGTQEKVTVTGSVASLKGETMLQTRNENPQNMLTGRVAGVRVWQRSAEPGTYSNSFDIRGFEGTPLVVIDGVPRTMEDFQRLNPNDIDDVSVLKDAAAAIYGVRAASGVLLVTTKKGKAGKTQISYSGSYTMQRPSKMPMLADPYQTMTIYNEKSMNNINGGSIIYDEQAFEDFRNGDRRAADWNSLIFADYSPQTQHNLSITGGSEKTQYFIGGGYLYQEGFFKSGDLNYDKFNLRSNITTELTEGLKFNLNLAGMSDQRNSPYSSPVDIIRNYWRQGVLFPAYADPEGTMLNYQGLDLEQNTVAMMTSDVSGYRQYNEKTFQSSFSLDYDLGTISSALKGLSAKAMLSYDYRNNDNTVFRREYYQYMYDETSDSYISKLYNPSSPNRLQRSVRSRNQILGQFLLNYKRTFASNHNVSALLGWESQKKEGDNFYAQNDLAFAMDYLLAGTNANQVTGMAYDTDNLYTIANSAALGRLNYNYADKYIAEFQFRYDGSSKFVEDNQWGFFPSGSIGWRLSEESFFKSISALSFVDQLKFRASYGTTANDATLQYEWYAGYQYPASGGNAENGYYNQYAPGYVIGGEFVNGVDRNVPNENLTWWEAHMFNFGVDFEGWNGLFGFSVDYFDRRRTGLFARRQGEVPTVVGTGAPLENANSDRQFGIDLQLSHRNKIGDLNYSVKAIGTITRREWQVGIQNGPYSNSYDRWRSDNLNNRYQGIQFGYESAGRYQDWEDIWNYPIYKERTILPGDYKYVDWNGDGEINGQDEHPYAFDQTPWLNFSLAYDASYKNFDLSILFQGTAMGSMQYQEPLYGIWGTNGGGTLEQYLDRWHPVDPQADPYNPETEWVEGYYGYTGNYPFGNSEFNRVSTAYLRLKSVELGYNIVPKKSASMKFRVFANAYNVFTITGVKFVDPEHPDSDQGRLYPLSKTYTLGVSATF
ncbi:SusC/RagA family TonB-linked outer membrane protein [Fulvivirga ligni]|uniref:SusC/RagA family TonB-linked outer membrane protein n=1 Tax=Fulvivirga ligni TaxID=2904246 RepID=UPI001F471005|nr:TonB-dependent receptor [Fulvivirga ligni]UII21402.1 TonB-dependent receptor [Fulvivirga ligni]